jgi:hypothetical protein
VYESEDFDRFSSSDVCHLLLTRLPWCVHATDAAAPFSHAERTAACKLTMAGQDRRAGCSSSSLRSESLDVAADCPGMAAARRSSARRFSPSDHAVDRQAGRGSPIVRRAARFRLRVGLACPAGSAAHTRWIVAIRRGHVILPDRRLQSSNAAHTKRPDADCGRPCGRPA